MKRRFGTPSFLIEYNSIWTPLLTGYLMENHDVCHGLRTRARVGLQSKGRNMIDRAILNKYGAKEISLKKDDAIFMEGDEALYYYQVISGSVKMVTTSLEGQEFIQGIFKAHDSFGEPALFCAFPYPSTARAMEPCEIARLSKDKFLQLLKENFDIHIKLDQILCQRLKYKSMILSEISFYDPEHRIMSLLNYFKGDADQLKTPKEKTQKEKSHYFVPLTRQQLADLTGLRVETVIRTVKKMEGDGKLQLIGRKIAL
jgi:CRP/FNR family transcriptional regulator, cyclic AMP receptor protein